jgi:pyrimidine-nucleoside phosphorylase
MLVKKAGDAVRKGDLLAVLHVDDTRRLKEARGLMEAAYTIGKEPPETRPLIYRVIE